jgi:hypothetical protein
VARSLWKDLFCYRSSVAHPATTRRRSPNRLPAINPARRPPWPQSIDLETTVPVAGPSRQLGLLAYLSERPPYINITEDLWT